MDLFNKILKMYSALTVEDFFPNFNATIMLQNDGNGDYIKYWNHKTFIQPTEQQLAEIE
jgi:hypothetical protein